MPFMISLSAFCRTRFGACLRRCWRGRMAPAAMTALPHALPTRAQATHAQATHALPTHALPTLALALVLALPPALTLSLVSPTETLAAESAHQATPAGTAPASASPSISAFVPVSVRDDTGHEVRLDAPAKRIIALYGAFNELLLALGAGDSLAARTVADANIPGLEHLPAIGTHRRPNAELIVQQSPDLVIQLAGRNEALLQTEALRALGLNVLVFEMNSFEQMFGVLQKLGQLTGREAEAARLTGAWQARLAALEARYKDQKPIRVFYEVRYPNLLAAGQGGIVDNIISRAGGRNVVTDEKKLVRFNEEALLAADPDVYVIQSGPMNPDPQPLDQRLHYRDLRAVREGRVLTVDEELFARPGPRSVDAAEELGRFLHPDAAR